VAFFAVAPTILSRYFYSH